MRAINGLVVLVCAFALVLPTGCTRQSIRYVDEGAAYTKATVQDAATRAGSGTLADANAENITALRHRALTQLRTKGPTGQAAASLITSTIPEQARGVPILVERATFDGRPAIVVVEAVPGRDGGLNRRRIWVLAEDGGVLFSSMH